MFDKFFLTIRSVIFLLGFVAETVFLSFWFILFYLVLPIKTRHRFAAFWCNTVLIWLRIACNIRYTVEGLENLELHKSLEERNDNKAPFVILCNHQSSWETIFLYKLIYPVSPILKKELLRIPFWGWAMALQKPIALDRSKPREAGRYLMRKGAERLAEGYSLVIFPEGTRAAPGELKRFSKGGSKLAVDTNTAVLPIVHNAGHFWPRGIIKHPGTVSVKIGSPISAEGKTSEQLTSEVEEWMKANLPD